MGGRLSLFTAVNLMNMCLQSVCKLLSICFFILRPCFVFLMLSPNSSVFSLVPTTSSNPYAADGSTESLTSVRLPHVTLPKKWNHTGKQLGDKSQGVVINSTWQRSRSWYTNNHTYSKRIHAKYTQKHTHTSSQLLKHKLMTCCDPLLYHEPSLQSKLKTTWLSVGSPQSVFVEL